MATTAMAQGAQTSIADSGSVRIIHHRLLQTTPVRFAVDNRPLVDLGGVSKRDVASELDPRQPFLDALQLSGGAFVVNERTQLKFFSSKGAFVRAVGRGGSGPGEFTQLRDLCRLRGDTLLAIDYADGRISLWDSAGKHIRTYARPGLVARSGCPGDGTLIVQSTVSGIGSGAVLGSAEYWLKKPDGTALRRLFALPVPEYAGPLFFEPSVLPLGHRFVAAHQKKFEFRIYAADGTLETIVRSSDPLRRVTDDEWQTHVARMVPVGASADRRNAILQRASSKRPDTYPAFGRVLAGSDMRIWIQDSADPHRWLAFTSAGMLLGALKLAAAELVRVDADRVVLKILDSDGAPHLRIHRLIAIAANSPR